MKTYKDSTKLLPKNNKYIQNPKFFQIYLKKRTLNSVE